MAVGLISEESNQITEKRGQVFVSFIEKVNEQEWFLFSLHQCFISQLETTFLAGNC